MRQEDIDLKFLYIQSAFLQINSIRNLYLFQLPFLNYVADLLFLRNRDLIILPAETFKVFLTISLYQDKMETSNHSKNGAIPKSHKSRKP